MKKAVLLMAYGGPDSLDDIEPYLLDIRGGRPTSPALVAEIKARYAQIGGRSPLLEITSQQAQALEQCLNIMARARGDETEYKTYVGMRHWKPYIREAVAQMAADGIESAAAICMAPHASRMSSGAYLQKLQEAQAALTQPLPVDFIESWHDKPFLYQSLARKVRAAVQEFPVQDRPHIHYLFTAHSLPASLKEQGDPYADQVLRTAQLLAQALNLNADQWSFAFQSAGAAPVPWLGPSVADMLGQLGEAGVRNVLVTPVGFMADHVEILYDLDIEAQALAQKHSIRLVRSETLNATPEFIEGLAKFLLERLNSGIHES